jgi:chromosome segregation ATPase
LKPQDDDEASKPVVSELGIKRVRTNIEAVSNNISNIEVNISACNHNLQTLRGVLVNLDKLEKEHIGLKKKYRDYVSIAEKEVKKNDAAYQELKKWEERHLAMIKDSKDGGLKNRLETARIERLDRERWKMDAGAKVKLVDELIAKIDKNIAAINEKRKTIGEEILKEQKYKQGFENDLREYQAKKKELELLIRP